MDNNNRSRTNNIRYHIIIPALMPAVFFVVAATPVSILGCRTRGLVALTIALISGLAGLVAAITGVKSRMRGEAESVWWVVSSLILAVPVIGLLILA